VEPGAAPSDIGRPVTPVIQNQQTAARDRGNGHPRPTHERSGLVDQVAHLDLGEPVG
jgi:hypothetical protein